MIDGQLKTRCFEVAVVVNLEDHAWTVVDAGVMQATRGYIVHVTVSHPTLARESWAVTFLCMFLGSKSDNVTYPLRRLVVRMGDHTGGRTETRASKAASVRSHA